MGTVPELLSCYGMISIKERKSNEKEVNYDKLFFNHFNNVGFTGTIYKL